MFKDFALLVDDHHVVVILGPVKAGIMGSSFPIYGFIHRFIGARPLTFIVSRPDTQTLVG